MIAKLTGVVDMSGDDSAVIDVSGVGYRVFCSGRTLNGLSRGEMVSLFIETHVRDDHIHLYGFAEASERDWFRMLNLVQGVGTRVALAVLTVLQPDELVTAIAAGDQAAMTRVSGVGRKLATRIVSELKDKVGAIALGPVAVGIASAPSGATAEAVSALVNLGYSATEALTVVSESARHLGPEAGVEALIRGGLAGLGPGDVQ